MPLPSSRKSGANPTNGEETAATTEKPQIDLYLLTAVKIHAAPSHVIHWSKNSTGGVTGADHKGKQLPIYAMRMGSCFLFERLFYLSAQHANCWLKGKAPKLKQSNRRQQKNRACKEKIPSGSVLICGVVPMLIGIAFTSAYFFQKHPCTFDLVGNIAVFILDAPDVRRDFIRHHYFSGFIITQLNFKVDERIPHAAKLPS